MDETRFGVIPDEHIPAEKVYEYWKSVAEDGGISPFIRLSTKVEVAEKIGGGWSLQCRETNGSGRGYTVRTPRLIISTGLTNRPSIPKYPTSPGFTPPVIHSNDFPAHFNEIVKPDTHTLVIGGAKSAWDIAYACCTQPGSTATMLIRPSGKGPVWMAPAKVTPLKILLEKLVLTRFPGLMSPCPWASNTGFEGVARRFLHGTWLGRKIVGAFWNILGQDVVDLNKYDAHPETKKLRPWRDAFEVGNGLSILTYENDFFDLVKEGRIKVVVGEVEKFGEGNDVVFLDGKTERYDAVVCATGWKSEPSIKFLPEGIEKDLGIPIEGQKPSAEETAIAKKADAELYARYPFLKERNSNKLYHPDPSHRLSPQESEAEKTQNPYRLFRFMVPPSDLKDRSIGFIGAMFTLGTTSCAYIQALWLTAYFDGTLSIPSTKSASEILYETYLETEYCAIRHAMGYGDKFPDLVFDSLPYFDVLLRDLERAGKRKGRFSEEYFGSYGPEDYRGLVGEWEQRLDGTKKTV